MAGCAEGGSLIWWGCLRGCTVAAPLVRGVCAARHLAAGVVADGFARGGMGGRACPCLPPHQLLYLLLCCCVSSGCPAALLP